MKRTIAIYTSILLAAQAWAAGAQPSPAPAQTPAATPAQTPAGIAPQGESANGPAIQVPSSLPGALARAGEQAAALPDRVRALMEFKDSDVKFDISKLMDILRDRRHEGWVLAAYPDPRTGRPLIGAGFSLDLPEREHTQRDPLNPHPFLEPSSAELWQAAGLASARLDSILQGFDGRLAKWKKKKFRGQIGALKPEITDEDASALLRIAIIQAVYNASAYCRNFEHFTASQQMAMTQLVYQMGVNLEEFSNFLTLVNRDSSATPEAEVADAAKADAEYWHSVQLSLVQSQWARLYRERAKAVIAMLDPNYIDDPAGAERSVGTILRPARRHKAALRKASYTRHHASAAKKRAARTRKN